MKFLSAFIKEDWQGWRPNLKNSRDWSIAKNTSTFLKLRSTYIDDVKKTSFHTYSIVSCQQWSIFYIFVRWAYSLYLASLHSEV